MKKYNLMNVEEFERNSKDCDVFVKIQKEINKSELPFPAGHASYLERCKNWNELNNQVVGSKVDYLV